MATKKRGTDYDKERYDRITITLHRGYRQFLKRLGWEINSDTSKISRAAIDAFIERNTHKMSNDLRKAHDELKKFGDWEL